MSQEAVKKAVETAQEFQFEDWQQPDMSLIETCRYPAPRFPAELIGGFWATWVQDSANSKSASIDYVWVSLFAVVASLIGNTCRISPWDGWVEPPILWAGLVGNPSSGKSPGMDATLELLRLLDQEANQDLDERIRQFKTDTAVAKCAEKIWEQKVKEALKKDEAPPLMPQVADEPNSVTPKRLYTTDATMEATGLILRDNPKGIILIRDELSGWIGGMDRYGGNGSDRAFYLESYGGRPYIFDRVKTIGEPARIPNLSISILGGIQPDRLSSLLLNGDDDGLVARFLLTWPEPTKPRRPDKEVDTTAALRAFRKIFDLEMKFDANGYPIIRILKLDSQGADVLQNFRVENADMQGMYTGLLLSFLGKLPGMSLRLALVIEFLWWSCSQNKECPKQVSLNAMQAAIELLHTYFMPMAIRAYGSASRPEEQQGAIRIARYILKEKLSIINLRDIYKKSELGFSENPVTTSKALDVLEDANWVRLKVERNGDNKGRRRKDYEVNPKVYES